MILPLSGGLDSRTLAVALKRLNIHTKAYSYAFEGGHKETSYAQKIANTCDFDFSALTVRSGYLWKEISNLASMNKCYSEFTNPRQMAFLNEYKISLASKLLLDTDLSISEIAYKTGYQNLTFFHRQFNKFKQVSPAKYRKNHRLYFRQKVNPIKI